MIKLTIINQKGGVGKSTTALAIAQYYTAKGKKVLLVDLDAQGNTTYASSGEVQKHGSLGVLMNPKTIKDEICHQTSETKQPDTIASTAQLANADTLLLNEVRREGRSTDFKSTQFLNASESIVNGFAVSFSAGAANVTFVSFLLK